MYLYNMTMTGKIRDRVANNNWYVYVLALEHNKYYVGISLDPQKRFQQHISGGKDSASFCKKHPPKAIVEVIETNTKKMIEACKLEDQITVKYMHKYGTTNVRGGRFFGTDKKVLGKYLAF